MPLNNNPKNERKSFIVRTIIISALLILNVTAVYLYYYVLVFNSIEPGKVYGESIFNGGRYEIYTIKYYYKYKNSTYFDKIDYVMAQDLQLGDRLDVRVLKPYPQKHMVDKVYRDHSEKFSYHCNDGFNIRYNEYIDSLSDYDAPVSITSYTKGGNRVIVPKKISQSEKQKISQVIDHVKFNRGSLVDYFTVQLQNDSIYLRSVYHYLNDYSTDAMPCKMMLEELKLLFPTKQFHLSILALDNAKKELVLDVNW